MSTINSSCPICDATVTLADGTEETEIITCSDCQNRLVVDSITNDKTVLEEAPVIEEDWGE